MTEPRGRPVPAGLSATRAASFGGGHLALDALVAFVDDELSPGARSRALKHLAGCAECGAEVVAQTQARVALRRSGAPSLPSSLMSSLRAIPAEAELPPPPVGLAVGPDGQLVSVLRDPGGRQSGAVHRRPTTDRWARIGTGAVVTGLALGGLVAAGTLSSGPGAGPGAGAAAVASIGGVGPVGQPSVVSRTSPAPGAARPVLDARPAPTSAPRSPVSRIPLFPSNLPSSRLPSTVHHHHR